MDPVSIAVGIGWALTGLLCLAMSIPLMSGRAPRNPFYGFRFPESCRSDEAWFEINRYGATRMAFWSVPMVVTGIASFLIPLQSNLTLEVVFGFGPLLFLLASVVQSWWFARRYGS